MPLLDGGATLIAQMVKGASVTALNAGNAYIRVGNGGGTAFASSQTDLQGASKTPKGMDPTFPTGSANILTYQATFGTVEANHDWSEWLVANASTGGTAINRKVESPSLGTKTSSQSWTMNVTLTFTA